MNEDARKMWIKVLRETKGKKINDILRWGDQFSVWGLLCESFMRSTDKGRWIEGEAFKVDESSSMFVTTCPPQVLLWAGLGSNPEWTYGIGVNTIQEGLFYSAIRCMFFSDFAAMLEQATIVGCEGPQDERWRRQSLKQITVGI